MHLLASADCSSIELTDKLKACKGMVTLDVRANLFLGRYHDLAIAVMNDKVICYL